MTVNLSFNAKMLENKDADPWQVWQSMFFFKWKGEHILHFLSASFKLTENDKKLETTCIDIP